MSASYRLTPDLKEALQMAQGLDSYVRSEELYGAGMFGGSAPTLTIGALLMRLRRLETLRDNLKRKQGADLDKALELHAYVQKEWRVHYEQKILKEAHSRLDAIQSFFEDCNDNPRACRGMYKPEALRRTIVEEIRMEMTTMGISSADLNKKARERDGKLRGYLEVTPFIWDEALQPVYPEQQFWWLYATPLVPENK